MKKISLILIPILTLLVFSCNPKTEVNNNKNNPDTLEFPEDKDLFVPETTDSDSLNENDSVKVNDNVMIVDEDGNMKPGDENVVIENANFYIIVGSYKNLASAEKLNEDFKAKGYNSQVLPKVGKLNRVAIDSFEEKDMAKKELKKLRKELKNPTFWLLYN